MDQDLQKHLDRLLVRAAVTLSLAVCAVLFFVLAVAFFLADKSAAFVFLLLFIASAITFSILGRVARREGRTHMPEPVVLRARGPLSFEEADFRLRRLCQEGDRQNLSGNAVLYDLQNPFSARIILYKAPAFDKKELDGVRRQAAEKTPAAPGAMRLCIICTAQIDEPVLRQVADNALHGLTRANNPLYVAVCHDQVGLQPLYGSCDVREVLRYKKLVALIENDLL